MQDVTECKFCGALTPKDNPCEDCGYEKENPQDINWRDYGHSTDDQ